MDRRTLLALLPPPSCSRPPWCRWCPRRGGFRPGIDANAILNDPEVPVSGNPKGDLTIVAFLDYNCPFCKKAEPDLLRLVKSDGRIRIVPQGLADPRRRLRLRRPARPRGEVPGPLRRRASRADGYPRPQDPEGADAGNASPPRASTWPAWRRTGRPTRARSPPCSSATSISGRPRLAGDAGLPDRPAESCGGPRLRRLQAGGGPGACKGRS